MPGRITRYRRGILSSPRANWRMGPIRINNGGARRVRHEALQCFQDASARWLTRKREQIWLSRLEPSDCGLFIWIKVKNTRCRPSRERWALISRLLLFQQQQSYPRCSLPPRKRNAPAIQFGPAPLIRQIFPMCTGAVPTSGASLPSDSVYRFP